MTFQIGSEFDASQQRVDPLFQRAMEALVGPTPALIPVPIKPQTRYEARLAALTR